MAFREAIGEERPKSDYPTPSVYIGPDDQDHDNQRPPARMLPAVGAVFSFQGNFDGRARSTARRAKARRKLRRMNGGLRILGLLPPASFPGKFDGLPPMRGPCGADDDQVRSSIVGSQ